jgi:hypothetical protein
LSIDHHPLSDPLNADNARNGAQRFFVDMPVHLKDDPVFGPQRIDQVLGCVQGDDLAVIDDGHTVAQAFRFLHEMGRQKNGRAPLANAPHLVPHGPPSLRVQAGGQLVQEDQLGVIDQRQGDKYPLFLPAGKLGEIGISFLREPICSSRGCQSSE